MTGQLKDWPVCQVCGRVTPLEESDGWLVSPLRSDPSYNVVRCPLHISEWSLRCSQAGRTKAWRKVMAEGKNWDPGPIPVYMSPFPTLSPKDVPKFDVQITGKEPK